MYLLNDYRPTTGKPIIPSYGRTTTLRLLSYIRPDEPLGFIAPPLVGNRVDCEFTPTWSDDRASMTFASQ